MDANELNKSSEEEKASALTLDEHSIELGGRAEATTLHAKLDVKIQHRCVLC